MVVLEVVDERENDSQSVLPCSVDGVVSRVPGSVVEFVPCRFKLVRIVGTNGNAARMRSNGSSSHRNCSGESFPNTTFVGI